MVDCKAYFGLNLCNWRINHIVTKPLKPLCLSPAQADAAIERKKKDFLKMQ